jgi:hypothetical protein
VAARPNGSVGIVAAPGVLALPAVHGEILVSTAPVVVDLEEGHRRVAPHRHEQARARPDAGVRAAAASPLVPVGARSADEEDVRGERADFRRVFDDPRDARVDVQRRAWPRLHQRRAVRPEPRAGAQNGRILGRPGEQRAHSRAQLAQVVHLHGPRVELEIEIGVCDEQCVSTGRRREAHREIE